MFFLKKAVGNGRCKTDFRVVHTGVLLFFYLYSLILISCAGVPNHIQTIDEEPFKTATQSTDGLDFMVFNTVSPSKWNLIAPGVHLYSAKSKKPPLEFHAVRIDLEEPGLRLVCTEPSAQKPDETTGCSTVSFARQNNTIVAINTTPFSYPSGYLNRRRKISGIYIYNAKKMSEEAASYAALLFMDNKRAVIVDSQTDTQTQEARYAFGGFWTILRNKELRDFPRSILNSQTAAGISEDGKILYLLSVVKKPGFPGASYQTTAKIMRFLGVDDAIMFDGGHSSDMVIFQQSVFGKFFRLPVASNLGFYHISD